MTAAATALGARRRSAAPALALAALVFAGLAATTPAFLTATNLLNILNQQTALIATTVGQVFVVLTGGLDLSVGSVVSLTTAILSLDLPPAARLAAALAAALAVGGANAAGVVWLRIHPILVTLATMTIVQGLALTIRPTPGGAAPEALIAFSQARLLGAPAPIFASVATVALAGWTLGRTAFGLHVYAAGGGAESARMGGVAVARVVAACYLISALCACLGGVHLAGRIGGGDPTVGAEFAIDSIAATALGGTLLAGGLGGVAGPMAGLAILAMMANGMNLWNVATHVQLIVKGALLVSAVSTTRRDLPGL